MRDGLTHDDTSCMELETNCVYCLFLQVCVTCTAQVTVLYVAHSIELVAMPATLHVAAGYLNELFTLMDDLVDQYEVSVFACSVRYVFHAVHAVHAVHAGCRHS